MPESAAIDEALIDLLNGDAELRATMPDGAFFDAAPPDKTRFVIVTLESHVDGAAFPGVHAFEDLVYAIEAVALTTIANANRDVRTAAARIDTLLDGNRTLTAPGYELMVMQRTGDRIRLTEVDDLDPTIRWYHRGWRYQIVMST
jgi:hypothetical protein